MFIVELEACSYGDLQEIVIPLNSNAASDDFNYIFYLLRGMVFKRRICLVLIFDCGGDLSVCVVEGRIIVSHEIP